MSARPKKPSNSASRQSSERSFANFMRHCHRSQNGLGKNATPSQNAPITTHRFWRLKTMLPHNRSTPISQMKSLPRLLPFRQLFQLAPVLLFSLAGHAADSFQPPISPRATYNFNPDWKFIRADVPDAVKP